MEKCECCGMIPCWDCIRNSCGKCNRIRGCNSKKHRHKAPFDDWISSAECKTCINMTYWVGRDKKLFYLLAVYLNIEHDEIVLNKSIDVFQDLRQVVIKYLPDLKICDYIKDIDDNSCGFSYRRFLRKMMMLLVRTPKWVQHCIDEKGIDEDLFEPEMASYLKQSKAKSARK